MFVFVAEVGPDTPAVADPARAKRAGPRRALLPGLVLAYRARQQTRHSSETGYPAATIAIITGWVGLFVLAVIVWWLTHTRTSACHFMPCDPAPNIRD